MIKIESPSVEDKRVQRRRSVVTGLVASLALAGPATDAVASGKSKLAISGPMTYYVSPTGSDSASGTSSTSPWKTLAKATSATLHAGDKVLLQGGASFAGQLSLSKGESGTPTAPITISSYGREKATIMAGNGAAIFVYDDGGIVISNIIAIGSGSGINTTDGIGFFNDLAGNVKLQYIRISGVDASGFGNYGVSIGGWNGSSGFQDVQVTQSALHDNGRGGLITYGPPFQATAPAYANSNLYVGHVNAYNNLGNPNDLTTNSGNGIVLGSVSGGLIERSVAHDNGPLCRAPECGVGIWAYDATSITIQHNESYRNRTGSAADGDGFDLDQNTSNSILQYNYSHENDGSGYLLYTGQSNSSHTGNTVRYNISQNDGRKNSYGAIEGGGRIYNAAIYDNTVYLSPAASGSPAGIFFLSVGSGVSVRNNVLYVTGGLRHLYAPVLSTSALVVQRNDYYSPTAVFKVQWGSTIYASLLTWRTATGQERVGTTSTGLIVDPRLTSPGGGGTLNNADLLESGLMAYKLQSTTPLSGLGLDLNALFGINMGGVDFYGLAVPTGSGRELGAAES